MIDADKVRHSISSSDWLAIVYADDNGPLPVCCANISNLRDAIGNLLSPIITPLTAARALHAWQDAQDGHWEGRHADDDPIVALMAELVSEFARAGCDTDLLTRDGLRAAEDRLDQWEIEHGFAPPAPEVRGYVVLTIDPGDPDCFDVNWDGLLHQTRQGAESEARYAATKMGHPEAHVGVVTALPAPTEEIKP